MKVPSPNAEHSTAGKPTGIVCKNVSARYGRIEVCHSIDLAVASGELVVILGPNGAGKSSFLGALSGLVQGAGSIEIDGSDLVDQPSHVRAQRGLAFVPEIRGNICPALSVEENLGLGLRMVRLDRGAALDHVFSLFPILRNRLQAPAGMLSGGEQQMLAIGMAIARRPRVLLLDEPTQGLAPSVHDILRSTIARLRSDGMAVIVAEQNLSFAASVADRFILLVAGRTAMTGGPEELQHHDTILAGFLG
jgi:branched-chain amino acid transport system ATP-binding protein